jgi:hypothetical protein
MTIDSADADREEVRDEIHEAQDEEQDELDEANED